MKKLICFISLVCFCCYSLHCVAQQRGVTNQTVTAKFSNIKIGFEGENTLIFTKADGSKIEFCRDFMNPKEPELGFDFLNKESNGPNKDLIGIFFIITYDINKVGNENYETGKNSSCKHILSVKKKISKT